jgi:hypothetical protein
MSVRVPWRSYDDIRGVADAFLHEHHADASIPVPIEAIVEFRLDINIVPIPGLQADFDTEGFLSAGMTEISVDLYVFEHRPTRYRFTLAHEVGHVILHGDILKAAAPQTVTDWKHFVRELPERERETLEWQAYAFGGLVLAPRAPLEEAHRAAVRIADEAGFDIIEHPEVAARYVATWIARRFDVSAQVIERRLREDRITS